MKIKILQENLQTALSVVQKALPSRPPLPILSSIHIKTNKSGIVLSATDLYFGIKTQVLAEVEEKGEMAVLGKQLYEIVTSLPPGNLVLEFKKSSLSIKSEKSTSSIQCQSSEDYPQFPESKGEKYSLAKEDVGKIDSLVGFSASTDLARPVLTAVLCKMKSDVLSFVATDGFRLTTFKINKSLASDLDEEILIPAKAIAEVLRIVTTLDTQEVLFEVSRELKQVLFSLEDTQVFIRLIEGEFPPYSKIIPTTSTTEIEFDAQELLDNIKRAMVFARESSNIIKMNTDGKKVKLEASSASLGTYEGEVVGSIVTGEKSEIAFNARYITEYLQATGVKKVTFKMSDSLKPAVFTSEELEDHQYIIMPFKVN